MLRRILVVASATCAILVLCRASTPADLTPEQRRAVDALVAQFTAPEFDVRQEAVEKLIAVGPDVIPVVRKAFVNTKDNEVKLRCGMVLKGMAAPYGIVIDMAKPDVPAVANLNASKVAFEARETPLAKVMDMLSEQSGNRPLVLSATVKDRPVTLVVKDATYWEAIDRLCESAGMLLIPDASQNRLALLEREGPPDFGSYAGPVVVKLDYGTLTRKLRAMRSPYPRNPLDPQLSYSLSLYWEDRLPVQAVTLRFTKGVLPDGKVLPEGSINPPSQIINPGARGRNYGAACLSLSGIPAGTRKLAELDGTVKVVCRLGERTLRLDDVAAAATRTGPDGVILSCAEGLSTKKGSAVLNVDVKREGLDPEVAFAADGGCALFFLADPKGRRFPATVESGRPVSKVGRKNKGRDAPVDWNFTLRFTGVSDADGKWSLLLVYPEKLYTRDYPLVIRDIPLP